MSLNIPNPSLLGILFVVSTSGGPQLVYQYPEDLSNDNKKFGSRKAKRVPLAEADGADSDSSEGKENDEYDIEDEEYKAMSDSGSDSYDAVDEEQDNGHTINYYWGTRSDIILTINEREKRRLKLNKKNNLAAKESAKSLTTLKGGENTKKLFTDSQSVESISISSDLAKLTSGKSDSQRTSQSKPSSTKKDDTESDILGIGRSYLCEMLCPPRQMCNTRFEIKINDTIFLGLPIRALEDGSWTNRKKKRSKARISKKSLSRHTSLQHDPNERDFKIEAKDIENNVLSSMDMFHFVFIMNPPVTESNYRTDLMFYCVVLRLSLVLKQEQLKHDYLGSQVRLINKLKEEYWTQSLPMNLNSFLVERSSLCRMISECCVQISNNNIAHLYMNGKLRSFQIPIKTEFHSLPGPTTPYLPGSHISSITRMLADLGLVNMGETGKYEGNQLNGTGSEDNIPSHNYFSSSNNLVDNEELFNDNTEFDADDIVYYALLLLDDPENIIRDMQAKHLSILANFIRMIKPTDTLIRLAHNFKPKGIENVRFELVLYQVKSFAFHLIYWRRARVILPLSARSVYIVSPIAPIAFNFQVDIKKFKQTFPLLPSLPNFLKLLSSHSKKPRQFATIIPSKDHHDGYLSGLAWLLRHGYCTQLHTYLWLKVSRKVRMKVEEDMEKEGSNIQSKPYSSFQENKGQDEFFGTDNTFKTDNTKYDVLNKKSGFSGAVGNEEENSVHEKDIKSIQNRLISSSIMQDIVIENDDTIILEPERSSTLERKWIHKIVTEECKLPPELMKLFYDLLKYMNGKTPLEFVILKENISRHELRRLLYTIEKHVQAVRHW